MNNYDRIYTAADDGFERKFQLASGYVSVTVIAFEALGVTARIEAEGTVLFSDADGNAVARLSIPEQTGGREKYTDVLCKTDGGMITLRFPIVKWIDNYPHCDGEHDRWDAVTIGYHTIKLDVSTGMAELYKQG